MHENNVRRYKIERKETDTTQYVRYYYKLATEKMLEDILAIPAGYDVVQVIKNKHYGKPLQLISVSHISKRKYDKLWMRP